MWALNDLKSDAERYDNGEFSAINRSSVTLRTIFYGSNNILNHLKIKGQTKLPTFTPTFTDKDIVNYGALDFIRLPKYFKNEEYFDTMLFGMRDDIKPIRQLKVKKWIKQPIFRFNSIDMSRESLIQIEANQDGGAHVDEQINKFYRRMRDGDSSFVINTDSKINFDNFIGGKFSDKGVFPKYVNWGLTRQIVHETLLAFNDQFSLNYSPNFKNNLNKRLNPIIYRVNLSD